MPDPIAYLWQNAPVLEDGCHQFYPTDRRADAEIAYCGGWKTPVFVSKTPDTFHPIGADQYGVFDGLDFHQPSDRLAVAPARAEAIAAYMQAEGTGEYQPGHPGAEAVRHD